MLRFKREPDNKVNERLVFRHREVRVIGADGVQLGVLPTQEALNRARAIGLDLVEVSGDATPPVCRIMDYGKHKYEEAKKIRAAKARQHIIRVKEIKLHPKTDMNDYSYRLKQAREFLMEGNKLKATIIFRGREITHHEYGARWIKQLQEDLKDIATMEMNPNQEGKALSTLFAPLKHHKQKPVTPTQPKPASSPAAKAPAPQAAAAPAPEAASAAQVMPSTTQPDSQPQEAPHA